MGMKKKVVTITQEDHKLYSRMVEFQKRNNTLNHVEDTRPALKIALAGSDKLPKIDLIHHE